MGYYIRALTGKKKFPKWKVQFISYKKADAKNPDAPRPKKEWDIPRDRWRVLGFTSSRTVKEALARAKQLNCLDLIKRQERKLRQLRLEEIEGSHRYRAAAVRSLETNPFDI